jgi:hypothetical protein
VRSSQRVRPSLSVSATQAQFQSSHGVFTATRIEAPRRMPLPQIAPHDVIARDHHLASSPRHEDRSDCCRWGDDCEEAQANDGTWRRRMLGGYKGYQQRDAPRQQSEAQGCEERPPHPGPRGPQRNRRSRVVGRRNAHP